MGSDRRRGSGADASISASVADAVSRSRANSGASQLGLKRSNSDPNIGPGRIRSASEPTTTSEEEVAAANRGRLDLSPKQNARKATE